VAAYVSDARRTIVDLPISTDDPVYARGLSALR
jgi:hypothetical protein